MAVSYKDSAFRSWSDAKTLHGASRFGSADHLYGVAAECALKAILVGLGLIPNLDAPPQKWRKHADKLWDEFAAYVSGTGHAVLILPSQNPFAKWKIDDRYEEDVTFTAERVVHHRDGAEIALKMLQTAQIDGTVPA